MPDFAPRRACALLAVCLIGAGLALPAALAPAPATAGERGAASHVGNAVNKHRGGLADRPRKLPDKHRKIRSKLVVGIERDRDSRLPPRAPLVVERRPPGTGDAEQAAEPAGPPDPAPSFARVPARGAAPSGPRVAIGEPLPEGVPYVTLDWRTYALPRPPAGAIYARVRREVLLIAPESREVLARHAPRPE